MIQTPRGECLRLRGRGEGPAGTGEGETGRRVGRKRIKEDAWCRRGYGDGQADEKMLATYSAYHIVHPAFLNVNLM